MSSSVCVGSSRHSPPLADSSDGSDASFRLTGAAQRMRVLVETNALLAAMGFGARSFEDYDDLVASVSSMGVALYEKLFQFHLDGVVRVPTTPEHYVHNAQLVVDALSGALLDEQFDAEQLTGASLCDGDVASVTQLVRMFRQIHEILYSESQGTGAEGEREDEREREELGELVEEEEVVEVATHKEARTTARREKPVAARRERTQTIGTQAKTADARSTRRLAAASTAPRRAPAAAKPSDVMTSQSAKLKKRTRRVEERSTGVRDEGERRREERQRDKQAAVERELLSTQRYGRFVPVPQRSTRRMARPEDDEYGFSDGGLELNEDELAAGETYFGGVSSVSGASGSAASIHFMEEEGEFAQNFSTIQSHSSPGTESKDSPEMDSTPDRHAAQPSMEEVTPPRKSRNQQEADDDTGRRHASVGEEDSATSPVKKKLATAAHATLSPQQNKRRGQRPHGGETKDASLYPLLPRTDRRDRTSTAHKEYLRYKIQLKDHLQELRQREFCQRQHLERAYRLGEHTANVERIRARRFEQELRLHRIAIGLEAKTQEEKQLRGAMQQMLHLEKEKLRDEHKTTTQTLRQIQRDHVEREQALETFYATQIQLVKEQTRRELKERVTVEKAHRMASEQMIREMRRERERELAALLTEKQHLAEVRRFRHATQLTQAIERGTEISARQGDAFYAAAMKARQLRDTKAAKPTATTSATMQNSQRHIHRTKAVDSNRTRSVGRAAGVRV